MKKYLFILCLFLVGCATMKRSDNIQVQNSFEINKPFNIVWEAIAETFAEKSLPIKAIEKDSGIITTDFLIFADSLDADNQIKTVSVRPSIFLGIWEIGRYSITIYAKSVDKDKTNIKIIPHIEAYERNPTKKWHVCRSKGVIEKDIYTSIVNKIK